MGRSLFDSSAVCSGSYLSVFELSAGKKADDGILEGMCLYIRSIIFALTWIKSAGWNLG